MQVRVLWAHAQRQPPSDLAAMAASPLPAAVTLDSCAHHSSLSLSLSPVAQPRFTPTYAYQAARIMGGVYGSEP